MHMTSSQLKTASESLSNGPLWLSTSSEIDDFRYQHWVEFKVPCTRPQVVASAWNIASIRTGRGRQQAQFGPET